MKKMNKRADIPVTILVIGVFVVCSLALLSFLNVNILIRNSFFGVGLIEKVNSQVEDYSINKNLDNLDIKIGKNNEKFFYQEKIGRRFSPEFGFNWLKQETLFSVEFPVPEN